MGRLPIVGLLVVTGACALARREPAAPASSASPADDPLPLTLSPAEAGERGLGASGPSTAISGRGLGASETATATAPGTPPASAGPPPAPPPAALAPPLAADLADPLDLLWGHRLEFTGAGEPLVTIRLMEGQREIVFRPGGAARVVLRGGTTVEVAAGARLVVRAREAVPAALAHHALLDAAPLAERSRLEGARGVWLERGVAVRTRIVGAVYGIAGRVVDNRRELLVLESDGSEAAARAGIERLRKEHGARATLHSEVVARPGGRLVLSTGDGRALGEADAALWLDVAGDGGFVVESVEHERGPAARSREHRSYRGRLFVTVDTRGALAAVHGVTVEELLRGLVPSEMPASSHLEALKAQAVTARSNVLAQVGTRHGTDPFMLCAEVHCQAYRGDAARTVRTDEAVRATRGEALFGRADRTLVDGVYSAMCGGHGEHNDLVWSSWANPSLRGRPDLPPASASRWAGGLSDEARLRAFLSDGADAYCRRPAAARKDRFRWERRLAPADLTRHLAPLELGEIRSLDVVARGVSGRARLLRVVGERGVAEVQGELRIRRLLGNLPSAMFLVERDGGDVVLRGGGWGHGAGMCQWGAVGRAEAGQGYQEILRAYFSGAEVATIY